MVPHEVVQCYSQMQPRNKCEDAEAPKVSYHNMQGILQGGYPNKIQLSKGSLFPLPSSLRLQQARAPQERPVSPSFPVLVKL